MMRLFLSLFLLWAPLAQAQTTAQRAAAFSPSVTVYNGLIGYWPLDNGDIFGTKLFDRSRNGNIGTLTGVTVSAASAGIINGAMTFSGSSQSVVVAIPAALNGKNSNYTMMAWANRVNNAHGAVMAIGGEVALSGGDGVSLGFGQSSAMESAGNLIEGLYNGTRWLNTGVTAGTGWVHIAIVVNSSGFPRIFYNGASVYSDTTGAPAAIGSAATAHIDIAGATFGTSPPIARFFNGPIDDARVYNRPLSANEIAAIYAAGRSGHQ
jgi:hypothetical protein